MLLVALVAFIGLVNAAPSGVGSIKLGCPSFTELNCPKVQNLCKQDSDCASGELCCVTNCGVACTKIQNPGPQNQVAAEKSGVCPNYNLGFLPSGQKCPEVFNHCKVDNDCEGKMKCCNIGCGPTCRDPEESSQPDDLNPAVMPPPQPADPSKPAQPKPFPQGVSTPTIDVETLKFLASQFLETKIIMNGLADYAQIAMKIPEEFTTLVKSLSDDERSALTANLPKLLSSVGLVSSVLKDITAAVEGAIGYALNGKTEPFDGWKFIDISKKVAESMIKTGLPTNDVTAISEALMQNQASFALPMIYKSIAGSEAPVTGDLPVLSLEDQKPAKEDIPIYDFNTLFSGLDMFANTGLMSIEVSAFLRLQKLIGKHFPAIVLTMPAPKQVTLPDALRDAMAVNEMRDSKKLQESIAKLNTTGEMLPTEQVFKEMSDKMKNSDKIDQAFVTPILDFIKTNNLVSLLPVIYPQLLDTPVMKKPIIKNGTICAAIDCEFGDWEEWDGECKSYENQGLLQTRKRSFRIKASCGGNTCDGDTLETKQCSPACEPEDCVMSEWWSLIPCPNSWNNELYGRSKIREGRCGGKSCKEFWSLDIRPCQSK